MITLATLPQATKQEVFDQVKNHLLTQNEKSYRDKSCVYRSGQLSCAAGCLMSDEEYNPKFESYGWWALVADKEVPADHEHLINKLQAVHDHNPPHAWPDALKSVARAFNLTF